MPEDEAKGKQQAATSRKAEGEVPPEPPADIPLPPAGVERAIETLGDIARRFLVAAWAALRAKRVVPPPSYHPHIAVGRDYYGDDIRYVTEFHDFEKAIVSSHPRFGEDVPLHDRDFPSGYLFSYLEACTAVLTAANQELTVDNEIVADLTRQLVETLQDTDRGVACCRVVSHLATRDTNALNVLGLTVHSFAAGADSTRGIHEIINSEIPGAARAYGRDVPVVFAPPESLVVAKSSDEKPFDRGRTLSNEIENFLLIVRLLYAGTCESIYEVQGETSRVRNFNPVLYSFRGTRTSALSSVNLVRRTVWLGDDDREPIEGLDRLLKALTTPQKMAFASFAVAQHKFVVSYHAHAWFEQVVDLMTAFEAALSGKDTNDVTLRLRVRAAGLLATDDDPAAAVFDDVGQLYVLRSRLVHGGDLSEKELRKIVTAITTVPDDAPFGVAISHVVDRLRDLVRRSLLARVCLATGPDHLWPINSDGKGVDRAMVDPVQLGDWRAAFHGALSSIGALFAADRPRVAADFIDLHEEAPNAAVPVGEGSS
jgi:hypothetical protein